MTQPLARTTFEPSDRERLEPGAGVAVVAAEGCLGQNVGGKAGALAQLSLAGLPVPSFLVLLPPADPLDSPCLDDAIRAAIGEWAEGDDLFAVRSSAADEDGRAQSYAGQLESYLFVPGAQVPDRVARVWQSGTSERVLAYRRAHGLDAPPEAPSVIVQRMVAADAAGVAFGADPVSGRSEMVVVSAVPGIGTGLVSGACDADCWRVDEQDEIVERSIVFKSTAHRAAPGTIEGIAPMPLVDDAAVRPVLRDDQIRAVARLTRRCGEMMGAPQDVEWAFAEDRLWLLQSRPITSLPPAAADAVTVWDNSNIAESYNGITTPLTFSFARHAYEGVYREFCRILGVANAKVAANDGTFRRMIGLIRGRVYYNMNSWYDALALLPGFRVNRPFMEQMMGVRAPMSSADRPTAGSASWRDRAVDGLSLGRAALGLAWHLVVIDRTIARFYRRLDEALGARPPAFGELRLEDLASHYLTLQDRLLKRWDAPLVNDFFAMIFHGALRRMVDRWCGERAASLQNDLLRGEPGMISVEPPRRIRAMAMIATSSPSLVTCLCDGSREQIERAMAGCPTLQEPYQTYLADFGDRCLEELKLESPTLRDDPMPLFRSIGLMARRLSNAPAGDSRDDEATVRARAEVEARACLGGRPITRLLFGWVLAQARARVRDRENLRFERTRLFGRVRAIFVEMGRRLHAEGCLDDARDVFWLEVDEVLRFIDGTATTTDLRGLVSVRRAEYRRHVETAAPGGRFETRGAVHVRNQFQSAAAAQASDAGETRKGHACCAGVVRGRVRVVTDPKNATLEEGDILVAARTDPGWVLLFSAAAGLVVEHGSLLSHSAIVARELGLPAVVSVAGATTWLRDNDMVELDGAAGIVRRLEPANDATADADGARMLFL